MVRGDRVAVLSHNDSDVFEAQFACQRLGAIFMPLNWRLATPELEFICGDAEPRAFLHGVEFEAAVAEVAGSCAIEHVTALANGAPSEYEAGTAGARGTLADPGIELGDTWTIMYTSGTTGRPKGARNLVFLPTFHTGGLNVYANPVFQAGGTNVVMRTFDPGRFLRILSDRDTPLTHALGVPTNLLMTTEEPGFADADIGHLTVLGVGGAPAPLALLERYAEVHPRSRGEHTWNVRCGWSGNGSSPLEWGAPRGVAGDGAGGPSGVAGGTGGLGHVNTNVVHRR